MATFIVTTLDDELDQNFTEDAPGGTGLSLREALALANADEGTEDTIVFDAGLLGGTVVLEGKLEITSDVIIEGGVDGDGTADLSISGNNRNRVLEIISGNVEVNDLSIINGNAEVDLVGGGVFLDSAASLSLDNVTMTGNRAADGDDLVGTFDGANGGAIYAAAGSTLTIVDSTIIGNRAGNGAYNFIYGAGYNGGDGGGIWSQGAVTITNSVIQNNSAGNGDRGTNFGEGQDGGNGGNGGGIWSSGFLRIEGSLIDGNQAGAGAAGTSEDTGLLIYYSGGGNGGRGGSGGGVFSTGALLVTNTTVSDNSAGNGGGGARGGTGGDGGNGGSGGGILSSGAAYIASTTFSGNSAGRAGNGGRGEAYTGYGYAFGYVGGDGGNGGSGGGLLVSGSTADLVNVTAVGNSAGANGNGNTGGLGNGTDGTDGTGGGVANRGATLALVQGTVTGNEAPTSGGGLSTISGTTEIVNSVIVGNTGGETDGTVGETASLTSGDPTDIFASIDAITGGGALGDNGGLVMTVALLAGGLAVDAGSEADLPVDIFDLDGDGDLTEPLPLDAKGAERQVGIAPDLGAAEGALAVLEGTPDPDDLNGTDLSETITALASNDTVTAGAGRDYVDLGLGDDTGDGGEGADTLSFASLETPGFEFSGLEFGVFVDLSQQGTVQETGQGNDTFTNFENLEGSDFDDLLTGDAEANTLIGGAGGDVISGGTGEDLILGGEGFDALEGGEGADMLFGGTGGNAIEGDIVTYFSATGPLVFDFGETISEFDAGSSDAVIEDTIGADVEGVAGATGFSNTFLADELTGLTLFLGGSEADTFEGGSGVDQLVGLAGDDVMYGNDGGDALLGEGGNDDLYGGAGADVFFFDGLDDNDTVHDLELGVDLIFFTGGTLEESDVDFQDVDADGNGITDARWTYEVQTASGLEQSSITVIDHDAATVEAEALLILT